MENHPIPQDVTGFKFKLIGSITFKQFLYLLAAGVIAAIILFVIPSKSLIGFFLIKAPIAILAGAIGAGLAFAPIDGRPMDKMIFNFLKKIPSENQFIYRKKGSYIPALDFFKPPPPHALKPLPPQETKQEETKLDILHKRFKSGYKPDAEERAYLESIKKFFEEKPQSAKKEEVQNFAAYSESQTQKNQQAGRQVEEEAQPVPIPSSKQEIIKPPTPAEDIEMNPTQPAQQTVKTPLPAAPPPPDPKPLASSHAKVTTSDTQLKAGFPHLPDTPNVIMGIVKDPRGKVLPNILVEVVDANNVPVRAFKTNQLGQFAAATPLPAGTYKIYFDDPQKQHEFDTIEVVLSNEIFHPLEIFSMDDRERLRRELFGGQ